MKNLPLRIAMLALVSAMTIGCSSHKTKNTGTALECELNEYVTKCNANIGVAVIVNDTSVATVNDGHNFPMNSVMKLFQAVAVTRQLQSEGKTTDTIVDIFLSQMHPATYSPMRDSLTNTDSVKMSVADLLRYSLQQSDNNACDILFDRIMSPTATHKAIKALGIDACNIAVDERTMYDDHATSSQNNCHPLAAATLINRLYTDTTLMNHDMRLFLTSTLNGCITGQQRLSHAFEGTNAIIGHKTGTGFASPEGFPQGINDVGFVQMPHGGSHAAIAVFIETSSGTMVATERIIADIGKIVRKHL